MHQAINHQILLSPSAERRKPRSMGFSLEPIKLYVGKRNYTLTTQYTSQHVRLADQQRNIWVQKSFRRRQIPLHREIFLCMPLRDIIYRSTNSAQQKRKVRFFFGLDTCNGNNIWKILMYPLNIGNQTGQTRRFCHAKSTSQPNADGMMTCLTPSPLTTEIDLDLVRLKYWFACLDRRAGMI